MTARLVLTGLPAVGKTAVGELVAARLGAAFIDTDALVETNTGLNPAQIIERDGEAKFRGLEADAAKQAIGQSCGVVSLGGGAVTTAAVRDLLGDQPVVWLDVSLVEAQRRLEDQAGAAGAARRPLLLGDLEGRLKSLADQRRHWYASTATWRVDTTGHTPSQVVDEVLACLDSQGVVPVLTGQPYDVVVSTAALNRLAPLVANTARVAVIASSALAQAANAVGQAAAASGARVTRVQVPVGEAAKTPAVLNDCWSALAKAGFTRSDLVIGVGGGATTDLAGFVASSYLRGLDWVAVPTSVLGMVDAAVGGKTGIDLPAGKNLVGAFHEPLAVLSDPGMLATLAPAEVAAGLAEVAKEGFTDDPGILELIEANASSAIEPAGAQLGQLIIKAVRVKASVVAHDLRERTSTDAVGRERLNYGHTLAHAIEAHEHFRLRHGEAVAIGTVFAAEVAQRLLGLPTQVVARHRSVLASLGLPIGYAGAPWPVIRQLMSLDKKARGNHLRMVLLRNLGEVVVVADPPEDVLAHAYQAIAPDS